LVKPADPDVVRPAASVMRIAVCIVALLAVFVGCAPRAVKPIEPGAPPLVDSQATPETRALFMNLHRLAGKQVMFGHQDDLAYGVTWANEPGRSDVKEVAGSYPAVFGWELANLEKGATADFDNVNFDQMRRWIVESYQRGAVITLSWHMSNPVTGGSAWDTTKAVSSILPGGARHKQYTQWLDRFADFASSLRATGPSGTTELVPVIFRPFHEMSGSWFWWGARHTSAREYRRLWRFTVEYLRDRKGVHNLLWAYATDRFDDIPGGSYWKWYPGNAYVDVLGFDDYFTLQGGFKHKDRHPIATMTKRLRWLVEQAEARGKVAALTETGYEAIPDSTWWTRKLLAAIKGDSVAQRIAWLLVWRNGYRQAMARGNYYAPYPGHASAGDFVRFRNDPLIVFENDLPDLYRMPADHGSSGNGGDPIPHATPSRRSAGRLRRRAYRARFDRVRPRA
jgi:mannan endo-1,4-beta-mannosidase